MRPYCLLIVAAAVHAAVAQQPVPVTRINAPIAVDGRVDEPVWQTITPLPLTTFLPVAGKHPNDSSEVRLAYDDKYLYASARFYVSDPSEIQSTTLGRDQLGPDDRFRRASAAVPRCTATRVIRSAQCLGPASTYQMFGE